MRDSPSLIPDDLRRFVLTSVPSVPYLEAMLLFHRDSQTARDAADVAARLYVKEDAARDLLAALSESGVVGATVEAPNRFRYAPRTPELADLIDRLASAYAGNLIGISNLIHDRTQRSAVQFADAFKLRKE